MEKVTRWKKELRTKIAFSLLIIPLAYLVLLATFSLIATFLEKPCDRDGIYVLFAGISIFLIFLLPLVIIDCSIGSFVMQILALRNGESKIKNILMMFVSVACSVGGFILLSHLWAGMFYG